MWSVASRLNNWIYLLFIDIERSLHFTNYFDKTPGIVHVEEDTKQDTNVSNENVQVTTDDYYPVLSFASHEDISSTHENMVEYVENETTENIETVLEIGCNATVPDREFADCIIMDFAGHKEYHSTHQTFLTKNAIYLVAFKFNEDNPFADMVDETGLLLNIKLNLNINFFKLCVYSLQNVTVDVKMYLGVQHFVT